MKRNNGRSNNRYGGWHGLLLWIWSKCTCSALPWREMLEGKENEWHLLSVERNHRRICRMWVHLELKSGKVPFKPENDMVRFHVKCQSFFPIDKHVKFEFVRQKDMYLILRAIFWYVIILMAMFWIRYFTHDHFL